MKNISINIYECVKALNSFEEKAYAKTIRTIFRGTLGSVSSKFRNRSFFGLYEGIKLSVIQNHLEKLCKKELITEKINIYNNKVHYIVKKSLETGVAPDFEISKKKNEDADKDIEDMIDEMFD